MSEILEEIILKLSRNGLHEELIATIKENPDININCQGKQFIFNILLCTIYYMLCLF